MTVLAIGQGLDWGHPFPAVLLAIGVILFIAVAALTYENERAYSAAIVYLGCGAVIAALAGAFNLNLLDVLGHSHTLQRLAELALLVAVFSAGLSLGRFPNRNSIRSTALLLGLVMPLTIVAVAAASVFLLGLSLGAALVLGATLAPTDPVLAVMTARSAQQQSAD